MKVDFPVYRVSKVIQSREVCGILFIASEEIDSLVGETRDFTKRARSVGGIRGTE